MKEEKKESPIGILWGWGKPYHGKFIGSIALAVLGVACQMVPYFCVAHIVTLMLSGDQNFSHYSESCLTAVTNTIGRIRQKIEDDRAVPVYIRTISNLGYQFMPNISVKKDSL